MKAEINWSMASFFVNILLQMFIMSRIPRNRGRSANMLKNKIEASHVVNKAQFSKIRVSQEALERRIKSSTEINKDSLSTVNTKIKSSF